MTEPEPEELFCPGGCHGGDFPDFDHYCASVGITASEAPAAFAAWLNGAAGWDGGYSRGAEPQERLS